MKYLETILHISRLSAFESDLKETRESIRRIAKNLPHGKLYFVKNGKYVQWEYRTTSGREIERFRLKQIRVKSIRSKGELSEYTFYLPRKEIKFASRVVKQELLENQLRAIDSTLQLIAGFNAAVSSFLAKEQSIINNHEKSRVMDSALEDMKAELVEWEEADYETNHNYLHELVHPTVKGHMVRSKSEAMIADGFYANGIPYRYEEKNILNGHIHYTDFAMRHPVTGKHYKLEHNGLMDKPDYIRKTGYRLIDYSAEGWLLGKNFFMTMETKNSPLTKSEIQLVIDTILSDETSE